MPEHPPIVADTNILFSALLNRASPFVELLLTSDYRFYVSERRFDLGIEGTLVVGRQTTQGGAAEKRV